MLFWCKYPPVTTEQAAAAASRWDYEPLFPLPFNILKSSLLLTDRCMGRISRDTISNTQTAVFQFLLQWDPIFALFHNRSLDTGIGLLINETFRICNYGIGKSPWSDPTVYTTTDGDDTDYMTGFFVFFFRRCSRSGNHSAEQADIAVTWSRDDTRMPNHRSSAGGQPLGEK